MVVLRLLLLSLCAFGSMAIQRRAATEGKLLVPSEHTHATCATVDWGGCYPSPNSGSCLDHVNYAIFSEGRSCTDAVAEVVSQCGACSEVCSEADCPAEIPDTYYPHFDTTSDHLHIADTAAGVRWNAGSVSDNFYLVIGDQGGCAGGCDDCCSMQKQVASKMLEYVQKRKTSQPYSKLLFVLVVGDNFYWTGASAGRFKGTWLDVYDKELTSVPWFAVMGNHDFGDDDPGAACPSIQPRFTCDDSNAFTTACGGAQPYSTEAQGYNCNQFDANKGGVDGDDRKNYHLPDYTYYYTIPELDFELIAMDWNWYDLDGLGGDSSGSAETRKICGSHTRFSKSMAAIRNASTELLYKRAAQAESKNVAIIGHYPDWFQNGQNFRKMYLNAQPAERRGETKVFNFYGHTHKQECDSTTNGECVDFMTGGSGGCCSTRDTPAGFVAISFDDSKKQVVECFAPDDKCTLNSYSYNWAQMHELDDLSVEVCPYTHDEPRCPNYFGPNNTYLDSLYNWPQTREVLA